MIYGLGTDIVQVARLDKLWQRHGEKALERLLAVEERAEVFPAGDVGRFLAKRFAAKEAFAKAAGTGLRPPVLLTDIVVRHDAWGKPLLAFTPTLQAWLNARGVTRWHVSISDEREMVVATVILEAL